MQFSLLSSTSILLHITRVNSNFLAPRFPPPTYFTSNDSLVAASWKNLKSDFGAYLEGNREGMSALFTGLENLTFSIGMFSMYDSAAQSLQYHYTSEEVSNGPGISKVDGDSIYRLASVSKLFTTYASMLISFRAYRLPPSLKSEATQFIAFNGKMLLSAPFASQIAGIPRDSQPFFIDLSLSPDPITGDPNPNPASLGLPPLDPNDPAALVPCCTELALTDPLAACPPELYFEGVERRPPTFQSWTTPQYTDNGFTLLGVALANITGKPIAQVYPDAIFVPLEMTSSRSGIPPKSEWSRCVIPEGGEAAWSTQGGISISSGGLLASLNDLAKFGIALLNSTLLPADKTRKWMKPVSHSSQLQFSVGAPWEIYRYTHADTGAVTDIYTKLGDSGDFTVFVCLIPDYDAGFNIISAGTNLSQKSILASNIADLVTTTILPALESQATTEAKHNFAGTYESSTPGLNSSLTLTFNNTPAAPGLYITSWTSNSTDMMPLLQILLGGSSLKLQPAISQPGKTAFLAMPVTEPGSFLGPFQQMRTMNTDWLYGEGTTYGGIGMAHFVFDVDKEGKAGAVTHSASRAILKKVARKLSA